MRTYVVTGAAGAGTTTVAAALAHRIAADGASTVLLASEPDGLGPPDAPDALRTRIVSPLAWGEGAWQALGLARRLIGPPWSDIQGHNLLPFPGLDQLAWWGTLREVWAEPVDAVVIDAGPLATAQRWLTLPDTVVGGLRRVWPLEDRAGEAADRLAEGSWHLRAMARIDSEAAELASQLRSVNTSVHLVTTPAGHELRRLLAALAPLAMFELNLTDIVLNRASPGDARHDRVAARLTEQFPAMTVGVAADGPAARRPLELGRALYPDPPKGSRPLRPKVGGDGHDYVWTWSLPMAQPGQVTTVVDGRDLLLTVGSARRAVRMPSVLSRCTMVGAELADHQLRLTFVPNPDVWPKTEEDR